jgi:co-chaperonin GroES (HSP10)
MLRPLRHKILVIPDEQPETTDSGLVLPNDHDHVPVSGTVAAVGPGGSRPRFEARQRAIRDCCEAIDCVAATFQNPAALQVAREEVARLLGTWDLERDIFEGARVVFPVEVGHEVTKDGVRYILLNEEDVAMIADEHEVAAA